MIDVTFLLRGYAALRMRQLVRQNPAVAQERVLRRLVRRARRTAFGLAHDFGAIRNVIEYQDKVPLRGYEDFWRDWWKPRFPVLRDATWPGLIRFFALSSGTTGGATKYIPVSPAMERANRWAAIDVLAFHAHRRGKSRVMGGASFFLGGSTALSRLGKGVLAGDLSGIAAARVPRCARGYFFPPRDVALIEDWREKIATLAPLSAQRNIRSISGTPSWLLLFFEHLALLHPERPRRLSAYWPDLELIIHGGVSFAPYRARFAEWLEGSRAELREVYPASEGFIAIADRGPGEGMRMILDGGLFYEFIPVEELGAPNPTRHWIGTAQAGVEYAVAISSNAGLWSYLLGDTVRLVSLDPPRLLVTGRTSYMLSVAGEHLIGAELDAAVLEAVTSCGGSLVEYAAGAVPPHPGEARTGHVFVIEASGDKLDAERATAVLDGALARLNADYAAHRSGAFGMLPPRVILVGSGTFTRWMESRGRLGGQNKVPRVIHDQALLASLLELC